MLTFGFCICLRFFRFDVSFGGIMAAHFLQILPRILIKTPFYKLSENGLRNRAQLKYGKSQGEWLSRVWSARSVKWHFIDYGLFHTIPESEKRRSDKRSTVKISWQCSLIHIPYTFHFVSPRCVSHWLFHISNQKTIISIISSRSS